MSGGDQAKSKWLCPPEHWLQLLAEGPDLGGQNDQLTQNLQQSRPEPLTRFPLGNVCTGQVYPEASGAAVCTWDYHSCVLEF